MRSLPFAMTHRERRHRKEGCCNTEFVFQASIKRDNKLPGSGLANQWSGCTFFEGFRDPAHNSLLKVEMSCCFPWFSAYAPLPEICRFSGAGWAREGDGWGNVSIH